MNLIRFVALFVAALPAAYGDPGWPDPSNFDGKTTTVLRPTDNLVVIPSLRLAVDLGGGDSPTRSELRTGHAIELDLTASRGRDVQPLHTGDRPVVFGGQTFSGSQDLHSDFLFRYAAATYRYRNFWSDTPFGFELLAGLGYAGLDLKVNGATQSTSEYLRNGGAVVGAGLLTRFTPAVSLQLRYTAFISDLNEGVTDANRFDASIVQALGRNAALRYGYSAWTVYSDREAATNPNSHLSPIKVSFSGLGLGFELMF